MSRPDFDTWFFSPLEREYEEEGEAPDPELDSLAETPEGLGIRQPELDEDALERLMDQCEEWECAL